MALIAASLSEVIKEIAFSAGTIHAAQEVYLARSVKTGERVYTVAEISSNVVRQSSRITIIKSTLSDNNGALVASATSTVITPVNNLDAESNHEISRI
jgi:acyl dehydratase